MQRTLRPRSTGYARDDKKNVKITLRAAYLRHGGCVRALWRPFIESYFSGLGVDLTLHIIQNTKESNQFDESFT